MKNLTAIVLAVSFILITTLTSGCAQLQSRPHRDDIAPVSFVMPYSDYRTEYAVVKGLADTCWSEWRADGEVVVAGDVLDNAAFITVYEIHSYGNELVATITFEPFSTGTRVSVKQARWDMGITDVRSWVMLDDTGCI